MSSKKSKAYSKTSIASLIDHTLLKPDATQENITQLCLDAKKYHFYSVCVNSSYIPLVSKLLKQSSVKPIAVVGFPLGASSSKSKAFEAREAIRNGAQEIDMVLSIGKLKSKNYSDVLKDMQIVVHASHPKPVKIILETGLLTLEEKIIACSLAKIAQADFVKTCTGFSPGSATIEDIVLMRKIVGPEMGVKASGGVRTYADAIQMLNAGATRIGTSSSIAIVSSSNMTSKKQKSKGTCY